jgi:hypothetical protein
MKKLSLTLFCFSLLVLASSSLRAQTVDELNTVSKEQIKLVFTTRYDSEKLLDLKKDLLELEIHLEYISLEFNEAGRLRQISAKIEYPDGKSGSFESAELKSATTGPGFNWKPKERKS